MKIRKCCASARFPGGIRRAKAIAKEVGFVGTVKLVHYGHDHDSKEQLDAGGILTEAYFCPPVGKAKKDPAAAVIGIYLNGVHAGKRTKPPLSTTNPREKAELWLHELGHSLRWAKGRWQPNRSHSDKNIYREYSATPEERSARRFAAYRIKSYWPNNKAEGGKQR